MRVGTSASGRLAFGVFRADIRELRERVLHRSGEVLNTAVASPEDLCILRNHGKAVWDNVFVTGGLGTCVGGQRRATDFDNFMVGEESKRNNNHRYSAGLGSMASAFKSQDTVKN